MAATPRAVALALVAAAAGAAPAHAVTLVLPDGTEGPQPYQRWADRAHPVPGRITLTLDTCPAPAVAACAMPGNIWLRPLSYGWRFDRATLWHELGHHFDYTVLHDPQRDQFRQLIGDPRPWRSSPNSPHETFAEAYRWCALKTRVRGRVPGSYRYQPTARRHRRICLLIDRAAAAMSAGTASSAGSRR